MRNLKNLRYIIFISLCSTLAFAENPEREEKAQHEDSAICPIANPTVEKITIGTPTITDQTEFVDQSRNIKDLGTDIVVKDFFTTPDTLFNFMKLVYGNLEKALDKYKNNNKLDEDSIFIVFKGGNVLRIVFRGILEMIPPAARDLLEEFYAQDFKRSDADFSVYIDETKLDDLEYSVVLDKITDLVFETLNGIREEFKADPQKYFNFFRFKKDYIAKRLADYFDQANELPALLDPENDKWYKAKFKQIRLLDNKARSEPDCAYTGQIDYQFTNQDGEIVGVPRSTEPDWIVNTDNRTLEWPWGSDPSKIVRFRLGRLKVVLDYIYEKNGVLKREPIGGELVDVSIPDDEAKTEFLKKVKENVETYTLYLDNPDEAIKIKAYSLANLAEDLQTILFDQFDRPWNGGPKYTKRINRLFFLGLVEVFGSYGTGSEKAKAYALAVKEDFFGPLESLYPLNDKSSELGEKLVEAAANLKKTYPELHPNNNFWAALADLVSNRLIKKPLPEDEVEFKNILETIGNNIDIFDKLNEMPVIKIKPEAVYDTNMSRLL